MDSTVPRLPEEPTSDRGTYCNCMDKVRQRLAAIKWLVATAKQFKSEHFVITEAIFVQFRKILELIAFASLAAHKDEYAKANKNFHNHWKAKAMLDGVAEINPAFYPMAMQPPVKDGPNSWHVPGPVPDALTKDEFERLYDTCGEILHMRNPFSTKDPMTNIGYSVEEWVARIERLVRWHSVHLLDGTRWTANVPAEGDVRLWPMAPAPDTNQSEDV
jgi:hypothetical protein